MSTHSAARRAPGRVSRLLPGLWQLRHYQRAWLRGDVIAGVTVAAYLVPQVMAYAEVAGLPAIAGLWAVVAPLAVYALLGSSKQLSVGPESTTALMTAAAVGALVAGNSERYAETAAALAIAVGVLCVVGWVARLGFLASLLSRPVLIGYLAGIAVLMIVSQLGKVTGIDTGGGSTFDELRSVCHAARPDPPANACARCRHAAAPVCRSTLVPAPSWAPDRDAPCRRDRCSVQP